MSALDPGRDATAFALYDQRDGETFLGRFLTEADALARVRELAAVNAISHGTLVYEDADGESLGQLLDDCLLEAARA